MLQVRPLAAALRGFGSLAMYEVVNEPEGVLDTTILDGGTPCTSIAVPATECPGQPSQPGWNTQDPQGNCRFSMLELQRFVNRIAAGLRGTDPYHLVTMGSWSHCVSSWGPGGADNLWRDECLVDAGGDSDIAGHSLQAPAEIWLVRLLYVLDVHSMERAAEHQ